MINPEDYMTTNEVMELFGVTRTTLYRWGSDGKLVPSAKVGRRNYYRKSEVLGLLDPEKADTGGELDE